MVSAPSRISIQWAVIVKYAFIHLECHRLYIKASFTTFQLLSLLNLLINSTCKLDISESIQCKVNKIAIHHCTVTKRIICQQQSRYWQTKKTKQCNGRKKSELEETRKQHLQNKFSTSMAIPFLSKFGGTWGPSFSYKP